MEYLVTFEHTICAGKFRGVLLTKEATLPFVPEQGMGIGFRDDSHFNSDEERVSRVMWLAKQGKFLVQLGTDRFPWDELPVEVLKVYLEEGWRFVPCFGFESRQELEDGNMTCDEALVRIGDLYYGLNPMELECLKLQGCEHRVLVRAKEKAPS